MTVTPRVKSGRDLMVSRQSLFPVAKRAVDDPLIYSNLDSVGSRRFAQAVLRQYTPRQLVWAEVVIGRYPAGAILDTQQGYLVVCDGFLVAEQLAGWVQPPDDAVREAELEAREAEQLDAPSFLAARYGETTWGHWLLEILPKIAVAEKTFPGLFCYIVPEHIVDVTKERSYANSVVESLRAYGISESRLFKVGRARTYKFGAMFDVIGATDKNVLHPVVLDLLRDSVSVSRKRRGPKRIAVLRPEYDRRSLLNHFAIRDVLIQRGFVLLNLVEMTFAEQVQAFQGASLIVGDLGSGLSAIAFATYGVRVVTLGPTEWYDGYFIPLLQIMCSGVADVRGVSTLIRAFGSKLPRDPANCYYAVSPEDLNEALSSIEPTVAQVAVTGPPIVAGRPRPRGLGEPTVSLEFGLNTSGSKLVTSDWSWPEASLQWTLGKSGAIRIPFDEIPRCGFWLELRGIGFVAPPNFLGKMITVYTNGRMIAEFISGSDIHEFILLPEEVFQSTAVLEVLFTHVSGPSPESMDIGGDARLLGIGLKSIALYRVPATPPVSRMRSRRL